MPKRLFKKLTPNHETIRNHKHMKMFGNLLHDQNLWHMNRKSVSGAFAAGLFWAMIPIPFQMVTAAASAIIFRVNLPLSVALVWLTNPLTMPPIFFLNYQIGTLFLPTHEKVENFELSMEWLGNSLDQIWLPLYLGSFIAGIVLAILGFISIRLIWRWILVKRYHKRKQKLS